MGAALPTEENNLKPWVDDERLNDPFILGTFHTITNLHSKVRNTCGEAARRWNAQDYIHTRNVEDS